MRTVIALCPCACDRFLFVGNGVVKDVGNGVVKDVAKDMVVKDAVKQHGEGCCMFRQSYRLLAVVRATFERHVRHS